MGDPISLKGNDPAPPGFQLELVWQASTITRCPGTSRRPNMINKDIGWIDEIG
jgi:hypothetical protein